MRFDLLSSLVGARADKTSWRKQIDYDPQQPYKLIKLS
jgi:hypothetical protein